MKTDEMTEFDALMLLHSEMDRQGPGDDAFTMNLISNLPDIPDLLRIADLGCGSGAASMLLASHFNRPVLCVDTAQMFLRSLDTKAKMAGLQKLIKTQQVDMGSLDPKTHQFDLLWSEGAAYSLTFEGAMKNWRPLLAVGGVAVVSEMSWFTTQRPPKALAFWDKAYPQMASENANQASAKRHGFDVLFTERLPASAWWKNYYDPLLARAKALEKSAPKALQSAIAETRQEANLFREFSDFMGYTYYILRAAQS